MPEGAGFNLQLRFIAGQAFCLHTGKLNFVNFRIFINYKNLTFRMLVGQHTPFMIIKIHGDVLVRSLLKRYVDKHSKRQVYIYKMRKFAMLITDVLCFISQPF